MATKTTTCVGCRYRSEGNFWCNYSDITGRSRLKDGGPLYPNGGCALYNPGKAKKRKPVKFGYSVEGTYQLFAEYYSKGMNDREIARATGKSASTVARWRKQLGLESNYALTQNR